MQRKPFDLRRTAIRIAVAQFSIVSCVLALVLIQSPSAPRRVTANVNDAASISPLPTTIGFAESDAYGLSPADVARTMQLMASTNVKTVRLLVPWAYVEVTKGQYYWADLDKTVLAAAAQNMAILGVITSAPAWATAAGAVQPNGRPASPDTYGDFAARVATRYKDKISAYEIWNEPNASMFYSPTPDPAGYTQLLKAAYPRLKAVDPSLTVVAAGLGAIVDAGVIAMNPVKFVTQMYAAGAKNYFDALAYHPYQYTLKFSEGIPVANSPVNQLMALRQIMIANGDGGKRIWATEYGEPSSQAGEAGQKTYITDMYTKWQELPYTGPLLIYTTRDTKAVSILPDDTLGVFKTDWTPKQAQQALQFAIPAGPPKSAEFIRFSTVTDPVHGTILSPVFRATPTVWAQMRTVNAIYETTAGFIASPIAVAQKALPMNGIPITPFANGWQNFDAPTDFRVWWSAQTGAHWASPGFAQAWVPRLGLATTDETYVLGGSRINFEHGYMTWTPILGIRTVFT